MRLTLRTMLAYMDGVLTPADAEELRRKIETNEGASGIMHRIRDVQVRLRLGAPKVEGRGLGGDANTVAEYLDNTLSADRIPEFERVCLESDAHLAEASACHHILALVLGERADVDPDLRRRLYGLIDAPEKPTADAAPPVAAPPVAEAPPVATVTKSRRKQNVPEYLREEPKSRGWLKWAIGLAALLLVALAVGIAVAPHDLLVRLGVQSAPVIVAINDKEKAEGKEADAETPVDKDVADADDSETAETDSPSETEAASDIDDQNAETPDDAETPTADQLPPAPDLTPLPADTALDPADEVAPAPPTPTDDETTETVAPVAPTPDEATDEAGSDSAVVAVTPATPAADEMGRVFLQKDVLLRYAPSEEAWKRLAQGDMVVAGDRLLAFPRFSPAVTLTNGVAVEMMGATQIALEAPDADGTPGVRVLYGRLVLMPISEPQSPVRLLIGENDYVVTFSDKKATLFCEVRPQLVNGSDPETTPALLNVEFFLGAGSVTWQQNAAASTVLNAPLRWSDDPANPVAVAEAPQWIADEKKTVGESVAAPTIEQNVTADRPVEVALKEAANHPRKRELRSLAAKCLALIGEYDAFVAVLSDPAQRTAWDGQIDELRAGMARSPEDAKKVRLALEQSRSADAKGLYRLLWGYTEDQFVKEGAATELLADLEHPDLDFRVLAFWNLCQQTGARHPYDPSAEESKSRKDRVELWQKKVAQFVKEKGGS